ncbi:MFS transporter [Aspergillus brunneoviolaceus CBS 621.78]|uniref:MFS general substrate transporter n=1 Tax=Aspergillus brunneoviolaceus CBS 621.78 TaxID=1450534 RepID=A0ACD1FX71_9EURO|nr:MFS general substrate transporter [Aspergillus brunneoviolaceus CBS 621.78]RAH41575.1 MFS general substrate transporter [Aspergillus brunneoviolaceus CBS 621.78]
MPMNLDPTRPPSVVSSGSAIHLASLPASPAPENDTPPSHAVTVALRWNGSKTMIWRVLATFWGALVMGANDAAYGAIIPYLQLAYDKSYTIISLIFLSPFLGYTISAVVSNLIHQRLGRRGVAFIGPACHLLAFAVISTRPPFPLLVIMYIFVGLGSGIQNAGWNVWISSMANSHEVLGCFHGFYGIGATVSPLIATSVITKAGWEWNSYYYLLTGTAALELVSATSAFWAETASRYQQDHPSSAGREGGGSSLHQTRLSLTYRATWICSLFLFLYGGIEVAIGGWIVVFMTSVRHGSPFASGMAGTGFWLGVALGRFVLGFVTPRIGEKRSIILYILLAIALEMVFWLVPEFVVSAVAVALVGFFLGTIFPSVVVVATRLLPKHLHVAAIGFAAAFSMGGGAVFPFAIGAIAQAKGVTVLQPILVAMLAVALLIWGTVLRAPVPQSQHEV